VLRNEKRKKEKEEEDDKAGVEVTIDKAGRKVAREVNLESFQTVDEVGDVELDKKDGAQKNVEGAENENIEKEKVENQEELINETKQSNDHEEIPVDNNETSHEEKERKSEETDKSKDVDTSRKSSEKSKRSSEKKKSSERRRSKESPKKRRDRSPVDLDKIVIKKREKKTSEISSDEKILVVKTPNNLIAKLAEIRKEMAKPLEDPPIKTEEEKSEARKNMRNKFKSEEKISDKIVGVALDSVFFDEELCEELIRKLLEEERKKEVEEKKEHSEEDLLKNTEAAIFDDHDKLDFEADEEMEKNE